MILPPYVVEEIRARLSQFEPPSFGKVKIEVELNYAEGQVNRYQVVAYPAEVMKRL